MNPNAVGMSDLVAQGFIPVKRCIYEHKCHRHDRYYCPGIYSGGHVRYNRSVVDNVFDIRPKAFTHIVRAAGTYICVATGTSPGLKPRVTRSHMPMAFARGCWIIITQG